MRSEHTSAVVEEKITGFWLALLDTFSRESGVSMAKAMSMTWDFEYDNGRKRWEGMHGRPVSLPTETDRNDSLCIPLDLYSAREVSRWDIGIDMNDLRRIPKGQLDSFAVQSDFSYVVFEYGWCALDSEDAS